MELHLIEKFLPVKARNRPGTPLSPRYITIHHTDNSGPHADAIAHANYLLSLEARLRNVSWHYTVDDQCVVKHIPTGEVAWHAGSRQGNTSSIGIEICQHQDIDFNAAYERAAQLAALVANAYQLPEDCIVPHRRWNGKDCPHLLFAGNAGWDWNRFVQRINRIR